MNRIGKLIATLFMFSSLLFIYSCGEDEEEFFDRPNVTATNPSVSVVAGSGNATVSFQVQAPGGYASASVSTGSISSQPTVGATSGTIEVSVDASAAGTINVSVTVSDQQSPAKTGIATAVVIVTEPAVGAPTFSGIPTTATISAGDTLTVPDVTLAAEAGLQSLAVSVDGTDIPELGADLSAAGESITLTFSAPQTASLVPGVYVITFTLTDADDVSSTFNHTLTVEAADVIVVTDNITANETWVSGTIYELAGRIVVEAGAVLTIEPGVVVKGQGGTGANASALLIARDAQLFANGTPTSPIIFTSVSDQIQPGQIASPNLPPSQNGLWGGLLVLGNAPISVGGDALSAQIEGIPPSDTNGLYGGSDPADNSGEIRYISIRHGGANIGEGNEINGLTLGGVGSGTIIENVEVVANQDDGIEWFGGTVDVTNALVWNAGDDAIDTDQDWIGTLDNFVVVAGEDTDHALELDGPEGSQRTLLGHTITNGSIKGAVNAELGNLRDSVEVTLSNLYFFNFPDPAADNDGNGSADGRGDFTLNNRPTATDEDPIDLTILNYTDFNTIILEGLETTLPEGVNLSAVFRGGTDADATAVGAGANTVGADVSVFAGWSWAEVAGGLADF